MVSSSTFWIIGIIINVSLTALGVWWIFKQTRGS